MTHTDSADRTDIILALQYGEPLMFYRDRMTEVRKAISAEGLHLDSIALSSPSTAQQIDPCLKQTLQDVMGLCALFNNGLQGHKMELVTYVAMLTSLLYRLLHFRSIGSSPHTSSANSAHHIGLVIFIGMLFIQRGSRQILQCDLLNQRVKQVVKSDLQDCSDNFAFWIMMTAGIWIDDGEIGWLVPMIREIATRLGITSWNEAHAILQQLPWIDAIFFVPGRELWNRTWRVQAGS